MQSGRQHCCGLTLYAAAAGGMREMSQRMEDLYVFAINEFKTNKQKNNAAPQLSPWIIMKI